MKADLILKGANVLNVFSERIYKADVAIENGVIVGVGEYSGDVEIDVTGKTIVPGFMDAHVHLESSLVSPKRYCKVALSHGTTSVITDPHEISNVSGKNGFMYMYEETKHLPLDVYFMVPSCVPATPMDESGAEITSKDVEELLRLPRVLGLAEMMDYPGVLSKNAEVLRKIEVTKQRDKKVDGHAPGLTGEKLQAYVAAGIESDHECSSVEEAIEKIEAGQWIMIREGTACKNLDALLPLIAHPYSERCMFVTDDKHIGDMAKEGHIDHIMRKAMANGADPILTYKMASYNAARYFNLSRKGAIAPGYIADLVVLDDLENVEIHAVYKNGKRVDDCLDTLMVEHENPYAKYVENSIHIRPVTAKDFALSKEKVIGLIPGEILTTDQGYAQDIDVENDVCKFAVVERHHKTGHIGLAYLKGYGLKRGAIATSIAHDSHNIIVAGASDEDMAYAVQEIASMQGGMIVVEGGRVLAKLALPIGGLMTDATSDEVEEAMDEIHSYAHRLGVHTNIAPFMTLSFTSLAVIPKLRLTTKGVVEV